MKVYVSEMQATVWMSLLIVLILVTSAAVAQEPGPAPAAPLHQVLVSSDPPGAAIWLKEGRDLTCSDKVTPATVELNFHGLNDFKQLLVTRFGYKREKVLVKATDEKASAKLTPWDAPFFTPPEDAPQAIQGLNASVSKVMKDTIMADPQAFRCTVLDFHGIDVRAIEGSNRLALHALVEVRPSAFRRLRSETHKGDPEREKKFGQAALEEGVADIFGRLRAVAARFPEIGHVVVETIYSANKAVATLEERSALEFGLQTRVAAHWGYRPDGTYGPVTEVISVPTTRHWDEIAVADENTTGRVLLSMPVEKIPASQDKKVITDAVLANAAIAVVGH